MYYTAVKSAPTIQTRFAELIKAMIEESPSFGYRTVAYLLGVKKNTVQRIFQLKGWQIRKRPIGLCPRIQAMPSVATAPNERWSTDLCRVWAGRDSWATLELVIDCHTRELLGWHPSRSGKATTASSALEHALIARFGTPGRVPEPFLLRSDNGLVFTSQVSLGQYIKTSPPFVAPPKTRRSAACGNTSFYKKSLRILHKEILDWPRKGLFARAAFSPRRDSLGHALA